MSVGSLITQKQVTAVFDAKAERALADRALESLGFAVAIAEDSSVRPMRLAWYSTYWAGRNVAATVVRRRMRTTNTVGPGNRHLNQICLQLSMEAQLGHPLGFGVLHPLGERPPASVAEAFPPDGPGHRLCDAAKDAFVRFIQPLPGERASNGRHLRFVDRSALADYLPPSIHPTGQVLVMHTIAVEEPLAERARRDLDQMAWLAWTLETGNPMPTP